MAVISKYKYDTIYKLEKDERNLITNDYIFKHRLISKNYSLSNCLNLSIEKIKYNKNVYEVINNLTNNKSGIKLFIDLDMDEHTFINYHTILQFCNSFKSFLKEKYNINANDIKHNIHLSLYNGILNNNKLHDKFITSAHIIFNIHVKDVYETKSLIYQYKHTHFKKYGKDNIFLQKQLINGREKTILDLKAYKKNGLFRCINQSKETSKNILKKVEYDKNKKVLFINENIEDLDFINVYNKDELLYNVSKNNICIKIPLDELNTPKINNIINEEQNKNYTANNFNKFKIKIPYNIKILKKHINLLSNEKIKNHKSWFNYVYKIIYALLTNNFYGKSVDDFLNHELVKLFLSKSRVDEYDTTEYETNNKNIFTKIIKDLSINIELIKKDNKLITLLDHNEIYFIEKCINEKITNIEFKTLNSTKHYYIINNGKYVYDINIKDLIFNPKVVYRHNTTLEYDFYKKNDTNYTAICYRGNYTQNYNLYYMLTDVEQDNKIMKKLNNDLIEFSDWNKIEIDINKSSYVYAPVGSGKSYYYLRKLIIQFINKVDSGEENYRLLIIGDIRTLVYKTLCDIIKILIEMGKNPVKYVKHYRLNTLKELEKMNVENTKNYVLNEYEKINNEPCIYITTYDSLNKLYVKNISFTHTIVDEFKNTKYRFINTQNGNTNIEKKLLISKIITYFNNAKAIHLLDADLDIEIYNFIRKYITNKQLTYYKLINVKRNTIIDVIGDNQHYNSIMDDIKNNKKIVIATTSKDFMDKISNIILNLWKDMGLEYKNEGKLCIIDKNGARFNKLFRNDNTENLTQIELKNKCINNTDEEFKKLKVLIYTSTITTGISYNLNTFNKIYVYANNLTLNETQIAQFSTRIRNTIDNKMIIILAKNKHTFKYNEVNDDDFNSYEYLKNASTLEDNNIYDEKNNNEYENDVEMETELDNLFYDINSNNIISDELNNAFNELNDYNTNQIKIKKQTFIYRVLCRLYKWGFTNIKCYLNDYFNYTMDKLENVKHYGYKDKIPNHINLHEINNEIVGLNQYSITFNVNEFMSELVGEFLDDIFFNLFYNDDTNFIRGSEQELYYKNLKISKYVDNEKYEELHKIYKSCENDTTQEFQDYMKTRLLKYYGISHSLYNLNSDRMNYYLTLNKITYEREFNKSNNICFYFYKNIIYKIINNVCLDGKTFKELTNKSRRLNFIEYYDNTLIYYYAFKVLDILKLNIYHLDQSIKPPEGYAIMKNKELMKEFYKLFNIEESKTFYLTKIKKLRIRANIYNKYMLVKSSVVAVLKFMNIKISFGSDLNDKHKKARVLRINNNMEFRVQTLLNNDQDDIQRNKNKNNDKIEISPKILIPKEDKSFNFIKCVAEKFLDEIDVLEINNDLIDYININTDEEFNTYINTF